VRIQGMSSFSPPASGACLHLRSPPVAAGRLNLSYHALLDPVNIVDMAERGYAVVDDRERVRRRSVAE
jgi:hypothetical protein